jgi:geranylgeranyl reductase family protein
MPPPSAPTRTPGTWDVIVVGAGPAGATAARVAAEQGCETLPLERAAIPRYKTWGGGLIGASLAALPPGLPLNVYDTARQFTFSLNGRRERTLVAGSPTTAMVYRSELDAALAEAAAAAGAEVRDSTALTALEQQGDTVTVKTNRGDTLHARAVVGADGSAGRVARYVGVRCAQVDLALEVDVPVDERTAGRWRGRVLMEWGSLPGSFGWVFPKGDVCTAGVVAARGNPAALRAYKEDFPTRHGLLGPRPLHDTGHLTVPTPHRPAGACSSPVTPPLSSTTGPAKASPTRCARETSRVGPPPGSPPPTRRRRPPPPTATDGRSTRSSASKCAPAAR